MVKLPPITAVTAVSSAKLNRSTLIARKTAPRYLVGIDLGTSNTVVAYADTRTRTGSRAIQLFAIEQVIAPGEVMAQPLLPSVRYHPAADELPPSANTLPWSASALEQSLPAGLVGTLAQQLGAKSPGRLVVSAKSWLSHAQVDRTAPILPWGSAEDVPKISPLQASASYLSHCRAAWNQHFTDYPLEQQDIVLTLPASFDEGARALTVEAARLAGLERVHLLEEPQAACYDWIYRQGEHLQDALQDCRLLLVCDVGGGTTDLSLIRIDQGTTGTSVSDRAAPQLSRIAVGDHLMLGGDNIDLAIAHLLERKLSDTRQLNAGQLAQLMQQCRSAKERLLATTETGHIPEKTSITLLGTGSRLIGAARSVELTRAELLHIIDGFLPSTGPDERPRSRRGAIVEFGLPYAADPAISKHLAAFLQRFAEPAREALGSPSSALPMPDAVLLNGGVFQSDYLAQRLQSLLQSWRAQQTGQTPLRLFANPQPDLAVARGAVAYGLARRGKGLKIGGGSARSYFLQLDSQQARQAICLLPRGTEEGRELRLDKRRFALRLGQPVRFHLHSATAAKHYRAGELVELDDDSFEPLPPIATVLEGGSGEVPVQLATRLTEVGTLAIDCITPDPPQQRWNLEFQLRDSAASSLVEDSKTLHPRFEAARELLEQYFGERSSRVDPKGIKTLRNDLEKLLGKRDAWDSALLRGLFAVLLDGARRRRRSADHERLWLNLTGFCLRPGFGYPLDEWRIEQLWPLYAQGVHAIKEAQNWAEWWTLWRRVAGGLDAAAQDTIATDLAPYLEPPEQQQKIKGPKKQGYDDMVRLIAALEHLAPARKAEIGGWLLQRLSKKGESVQTWWALGRIGTRVPFHGSAHQVVDSETAGHWLSVLLQQDWRKVQPAAFAATMLARLSGDRSRDLPDDLRQRTIQRLRELKAPAQWITMISEVSELDDADTKRFFGEGLPTGLRLAD